MTEKNATSDSEPGQPPTRRSIKNASKQVRIVWLLIAGTIFIIGSGVQRLRRAQDPNLMEIAARVVSMSHFSGYDGWQSNQELTLYQWQRKGAALFRCNVSTQSITALGCRQTYDGSIFEHGPYALVTSPKLESLVVEAWQQERGYHQVPVMPPSDYVWKLKRNGTANPIPNSYALSPDGKRVAYISMRVHQVVWDKFMQRFRPSYPVREWQNGAIYVSDVDGIRTECVGYVEPDMPASGSRFARSGMTASLQRLAWLPDGKHISFLYGDGLYTVSVER